MNVMDVIDVIDALLIDLMRFFSTSFMTKVLTVCLVIFMMCYLLVIICFILDHNMQRAKERELEQSTTGQKCKAE